MKTALIISGGDYSSLPDFLQFDICIACDKGYRYALEMGIKPDVIMGDFDSSSKPENTDIPVLTYPVEKDDTDTMLAIKYAMNKGFEHIVILCALGKRLDHTLANIQSMAYVACHNGVAEIISDNEHLRTLTGNASVSLSKKDGCSLSLFSLCDRCDGVTVKGAKYEVANATVTNTFPIGCSNDWKENEVTVSLKSGILLVVESKME